MFFGYDDETPDELAWSEWNGEYLCENCRTWCEGIDDYVRRDVSVVDVFAYSNRYTITYPREYVMDSLTTETETEHIGDDDYFICFNGVWYRLDSDKLTIKDNVITLKD